MAWGGIDGEVNLLRGASDAAILSQAAHRQVTKERLTAEQSAVSQVKQAMGFFVRARRVETEQKERDLEAALKLLANTPASSEPIGVHARQQLASLLVTSDTDDQRLDRALALSREVTRIEPNNSGAWNLLGFVHFQRG